MKVHLWLGLFLGMAIVPAETSGAPAASTAGPNLTPPPAAGAVTAPAPPAGDPGAKLAAPKRTKLTCAQYRDSVEKTAKHAAFDTRLKPGSWARIPPELRKLPRRAKFCGVDSRGQAVIASPLFGKDLQDYYTPLFAKLEFQPLTCAITAQQTQCQTKRHRDIGIVVADTASEIYVLAVVLR